MEKKALRKNILIIAVTMIIAAGFLALGDLVLLGAIGVPGLIIGEFLAGCTVVISLIIFPVGEKIKLHDFAPPSLKELLSSSFIYAGALLLGICSVVLFEYSFPDVAVADFHIMDYLPMKKIWVAGIYAVVMAASGTALFYVYFDNKLEELLHEKYLSLIGLLTAFIYAALHFQLYTFVFLIIIEYTVITTGDKIRSNLLCFVFHLITEISNLLILQSAGNQIMLMGEDFGLWGTVAFVLITVAPAILSLIIGIAIMGGFKDDKMKLIVLISIAIVSLAAGFGIKAL